MRKWYYYIVIILVIGVVSNADAFVSFGLKGGYVYESITAKKVHIINKTTTQSGTWTTDTTYTPTDEEAETYSPKGFGGELLMEVVFPIIPIGMELGIGSYTTSYENIINSTKYTYTINSIKASGVGKYIVKGIPMISPWIGIGPFIGLDVHKSKIEDLNITFEGERVVNWGILSGLGANIGITPKLALSTGVLFNYFIVSNGKATAKYTIFNTTYETTSEIKYSQWNTNFLVGLTYKIM
ncbi:MAG: hypothetical protein HY769_03715 [Candidatus Stahlbacteria bacterium]|nr:hypothetical protein [Candidatus Stahlbacteria bacterium]